MAKQGQKKDGTAKKSTKGIPRVTDKVLAGGDALAKYNKAVATLSPELQAECKARLATAQSEGRKAKKVDFATVFNGRTIEDLTTAKTALDIALAAAAETAEKEAEAKIAELQASIAAMKEAKAKVGAAAAVTA